ncbi:hypothetical protein GCM10025870_06490 [Agromyces marinus]|uniref:DUF222 domain-containing protein n=1 Tax=Agromyces marinus TaxID=1389020 RepID=A0ABM8GYM5_9MICO|nr:hypothetical protein GCM10025870_06490 [Agromyces marinus]
MGREPVDALAREAHLAGAFDQAEDRPDRRGLADAVASEQGGHARRGHVERDVLDDLLSRDPAVQAADRQDGFCGRMLAGHAAVPR